MFEVVYVHVHEFDVSASWGGCQNVVSTIHMQRICSGPPHSEEAAVGPCWGPEWSRHFG